MKYEANIYQMTVENHTFWVAESKELKGCVGQGETSEEAISELEHNENEWIETAIQVGIPVPTPTSKAAFSHNGKVALRLAPNVHSDAAAYASELGISLNQYLNNAVVEYNVLMKDFLRRPTPEQRHKNGSDKVLQFPVNYQQFMNTVISDIDNPEEM